MKKHWIVLFILVVILGTLAYLSTWTVDMVKYGAIAQIAFIKKTISYMPMVN